MPHLLVRLDDLPSPRATPADAFVRRALTPERDLVIRCDCRTARGCGFAGALLYATLAEIDFYRREVGAIEIADSAPRLPWMLKP